MQNQDDEIINKVWANELKKVAYKIDDRTTLMVIPGHEAEAKNRYEKHKLETELVPKEINDKPKNKPGMKKGQKQSISDDDVSKILGALDELYEATKSNISINAQKIFHRHEALYSSMCSKILEQIGIVNYKREGSNAFYKWIGPEPSAEMAQEFLKTCRNHFHKDIGPGEIIKQTKPITETIIDSVKDNEKIPPPPVQLKPFVTTKIEMPLSEYPFEVLTSEISRRGFKMIIYK